MTLGKLHVGIGRMRKFFTLVARWLRSGWGAVSGVGLLHALALLWRRMSDVSTAQTVLGIVNIDVPRLVSIASSPFTGVFLVVLGLCGLPAVIESQRGKKLSWFWPYLGWGVFVMCSSLMLSSLLFWSDVDQTGGSTYLQMPERSKQESGITPKKFMTFYLGSSPIEARDAAEPFFNKLMHFQGTLLHPIQVQGSGYVVELKDVDGTTISCEFGASFEHKARSLKIGDRVTGTGTIRSSQNGNGVALIDCLP